MASDTETTFDMIHYFNWPRKRHTTIAACRTCNKAIRTLCNESKVKLRVPLGQWTLDDNKYIKPVNGSCPVIFIHSIIYKMEHEENKNDLLNERVGELHCK